MQCNEARTDDAPPAEMNSSNPIPLGKKGSDTGWSNTLLLEE